MSEKRVWIGWDPSEMEAWNVAERSARANSSVRLDVKRLALMNLKAKGLYHRPTERRDGQLWDVISEAPMSTEHAIARFFVPYLNEYHGWALFMDGDVLVRGDLAELLALADPKYAVQVVKHPQTYAGRMKKESHVQTLYAKKWWSSVMLFNCEHPSHRFLTTSSLNLLPGRDLHRFCWLGEHEIGALPSEWNHLVGVSESTSAPNKIVHFTLGTPNVKGHEDDDYADEWKGFSKRSGYRQLERQCV